MKAIVVGAVVVALLSGAVTAFAHGERVLAPRAECRTADATASASRSDPEGEFIGLRSELVVAGLDSPSDVLQMPGSDVLLVAEKAGRIVAVQDGEVLDPPVLDIERLVSSDWNERGLLSIEAHPDFSENCQLLLFYTDVHGDSNLASATFTRIEPLAIDPASIRRILAIPQNHPYHQSGSMTFGPDGLLWVSVGDGGLGDELNGLDPTTLKGSVLRIDIGSRSYTSPSNNPFVGSRDGRSEVWAYGLRNPWRMSIDHEEGMVYVPDVGEKKMEEINVVPITDGGANFGWPTTEGTACHEGTECDTDGITFPVYTYERSGGNCAIVGGEVYRGSSIPEVHGHYFFSDFCSGHMRSFVLESGAVTSETDWRDDLANDGQVTSFGSDDAGELYFSTLDGNLWRIVASRR